MELLWYQEIHIFEYLAEACLIWFLGEVFVNNISFSFIIQQKVSIEYQHSQQKREWIENMDVHRKHKGSTKAEEGNSFKSVSNI